MDEFQSEKEQIEEIKNWWKKNGSFIVTGVILGVAVLTGWQYWRSYQEQRASAASANYEELVQAIGRNDRDAATDLMRKFTEDFGSTPYYSQGALAMAKLYVQSDEPELASEQLRDVLDRSGDENLKLVARLRLARVQLSQDRAQDALITLNAADPAGFAARFHEVRGDAYAALGRTDEARSEYTSALEAFEPGLLDQQMVEMKLNDLAVANAGNSQGAASEMVPATEMPADSTSETTPDTQPDIEPGA